jgi:hypothetical protein
MATYRYVARSSYGNRWEGQLTARSSESVAAALTTAGWIPLSIVMVSRTNAPDVPSTLTVTPPTSSTDARVRPQRPTSGGWSTEQPTWFDKLCARLRHIFLVDKSNKQLM